MKSLRICTILAIGVLLASCSPKVEEYPKLPDHIIPEGLKDCKFYSVRFEGGSSMKVARCPNSATTSTYNEGKSTYSATVVEDPPRAPGQQTRDEHNARVDALLKKIDEDIARLEARKKELK